MGKMILFAFVAVAALVAQGYDSVQLNYRGHLSFTSTEPRSGSVDMTFRLYAGKSDSEAVWTKTVEAVRLDDDGFFQVALAGNGLDKVIDSGDVGYIGVTIGDGQEQYPRQQLLSSAWSEKSVSAGGLMPSSKIGTVAAGNAEFGELTAGSVSASGTVRLPQTEQMLPAEVAHVKKDFVLKTKGTVSLFRQGAPIDMGTATTSGGKVVFGTATCNCAVFFTSVDSTAMPGLTRLVKTGESIEVPSMFQLPDGLTVRCWVYPIGAE